VLPIELVEDPARAQVLVQRRRPPIQNRRASHGRAQLQLLEVRRNGAWQLEPRVEVLISPGQAEPAMQATALHELGHAFGLWGHSDQPGDAMAVSPGAQPLLQLSGRDRATLHWLQGQPGLRQELLAPRPPAAP
jgi:predicted Zn-dependent protease